MTQIISAVAHRKIIKLAINKFDDKLNENITSESILNISSYKKKSMLL